MDSKQETVTQTFTREQLLDMPADKLAELLKLANRPDVMFSGRAVVRKKDGSVRCDPGVKAEDYEA